MSKFTNFVNEIKDGLSSNCYLAIIPNDDGYDIEVEVDEGTIAGNFATETSTLSIARKVADQIEKELWIRGINVFKNRILWEDFLNKENEDDWEWYSL